jgi:hypothetical protein
LLQHHSQYPRQKQPKSVADELAMDMWCTHTLWNTCHSILEKLFSG